MRTLLLDNHDSYTYSPQANVTRLSRHRLHFAVHNGPVAPEQLYTSLFASSARSFWLDETGAGQARFSYFGDDSGPLAEFCSYDVDAGVIEVHREQEPVSHVHADILTYVRRSLARRAFPPPDLPFDFTCGYVGYEFKAWLFADRVVVIDRMEQTAYALCLAEDSRTAEAEAIGWLDATLEHLECAADGSSLSRQSAQQ